MMYFLFHSKQSFMNYCFELIFKLRRLQKWTNTIRFESLFPNNRLWQQIKWQSNFEFKTYFVIISAAFYDLWPDCFLLSRVNPNGPADRSGCLDNDRVIEVNGVNVQHLSHAQVAELIKFSLRKSNSKKYRVTDKTDKK